MLVLSAQEIKKRLIFIYVSSFKFQIKIFKVIHISISQKLKRLFENINSSKGSRKKDTKY